MADSVCGSEKVEPVPSATPPMEIPTVQGKVPQGILDAIIKEAATLAKVQREKLVILRAQPVVWNDGSLGCPEPGMMYTQALVNGYWVVIMRKARRTTSASTRAAGFTCARPVVGVRRAGRTDLDAFLGEGRELSCRTAAERLHFGCGGSRAQQCPLGTATVHYCLESNRPRRHGYRHGIR